MGENVSTTFAAYCRIPQSVAFPSSINIFLARFMIHAVDSVAFVFHLQITSVKPLLSGHLWDLLKSPLKRGCPLNKAL